MTDHRLIQVSTAASYSELREAQEQVNEAIAKVASDARNEGVAQVVALIKEFEITPEELNQALSGKAKRGRKPRDPNAPKTPKAAKGAGKKAAPKYRNPLDPEQTWSGRGIAPLWIRDFSKEDRDQFLIEQEEVDGSQEDQSVSLPEEEEDESEIMETKPLFASVD